MKREPRRTNKGKYLETYSSDTAVNFKMTLIKNYRLTDNLNKHLCTAQIIPVVCSYISNQHDVHAVLLGSRVQSDLHLNQPFKLENHQASRNRSLESSFHKRNQSRTTTAKEWSVEQWVCIKYVYMGHKTRHLHWSLATTAPAYAHTLYESISSNTHASVNICVCVCVCVCYECLCVEPSLVRMFWSFSIAVIYICTWEGCSTRK